MRRVGRGDGPRLPAGVRLIDALMRSHPAFSIAKMDEELLRRIQETPIPEGGPVSLVVGRLRRGVRVATRTFPGPHGDLPLRVYTPPGAEGDPRLRPVVLNFHGGGFSLGSARQGDWMCGIVAAEVDAVVVSVDYRLAPTHRFPAAVEDCCAALEWTRAHAVELGGDPERLGVMGDSAGGNLAAVVTLAARDQDGPPIRHQALLYPATDLTDGLKETDSYRRNTRGIVLGNEDLEVFHGHYVDEGVDTSDWRLSPLHASDHSRLPPAVVVVAGLDPLHDSAVAYAEALAAAGVPVQVEDFHLMPHGFLSFPYLSRGARPAMRAVVEHQRAHLGQGPSGSANPPRAAGTMA